MGAGRVRGQRVETVLGAACILTGDTRHLLATLPAESAQCSVTSPPYYGLRDYGVDGQIGLEPTPLAYVAELVEVFRDVRRVLRDDGTLWLNLGDSYAGSWGARGRAGHTNAPRPDLEGKYGTASPARHGVAEWGVKPKDLLGIPWRVAFALQADGWYLRSAIVWHKPNPMPESVRDRPTSAYEMVFLLAKSDRYFYDAGAIAELAEVGARGSTFHEGATGRRQGGRASKVPRANTETRNARNVWTISPKPFKGPHFATMPVDLAERCILAGSFPGATVLDPFGGAGTTALAALRNGRDAILTELNPEYAALAKQRLISERPDIESREAALIEAMAA